MFFKGFKGGVHPSDFKHYTKDFPIKEISAPDVIVLPISQHIGAPNEPIVCVGDYVKVGQCVATSAVFVSAPVHSPVSGVVKEIGTTINPQGIKVPAIVIENDGLDELSEQITPCNNLDLLTSEDIVRIVRNAGIVGMGGASFPTHVKLSPPPDKQIDCCIVNGAECEPYLTSDYRVMLERPERLVFGLKMIMKALNAAQGIIAVENNKKDAYKIIKENIDTPDIKVMLLPTKYPQGSEKHLIKATTGRKVKSGKLPMDVGVVVSNVDTCVSIGDAVEFGRPLISRIVTVSGNCFNNKGNYRVRIGTPIEHIIKEVGGFTSKPSMLILGGPMMGTTLYSTDVSVMKNTGAVLALGKDEINLHSAGPCLRCGKCVDACPMQLQPLYLMANCEIKDYEKLQQLNILDCIECGACTYACPSKRHIVQSIRIRKQEIVAIQRKVKQ
ncbi:MAG: electron transport complex subunit RsxC [Eubacteriales bacterium]|nr:electron transport complex subunit RsxC [Eubacteriales bacterium]